MNTQPQLLVCKDVARSIPRRSVVKLTVFQVKLTTLSASRGKWNGVLSESCE